jgi:hypothetical protein
MGHTEPPGAHSDWWRDAEADHSPPSTVNLLVPELFLIFAHAVFKMLIIQEPNEVEL